MNIIIQLVSLLFYTRAVYSGTCKIETDNTNDYMCTNTASSISMTNIGCGQANYISGASAETVSSPPGLSCSDGYVIDCILFASYGKVAGSCKEFEDESLTCYFGDDVDYIHVHQSIGEHCKGQSTCDITVSDTQFSINTITGTTITSKFITDKDLLALAEMPEERGLKVLFQCALPNQDESEYNEYEFILDDSNLSDITDLDIQITGNCVDGNNPTINPQGDIFNECDYNMFRFTVYSGENILDDTKWWKLERNVLNCDIEYHDSLTVDIDGIGYDVQFTVIKTGGDC